MRQSVNADKLNSLVGKMLGDLGGAFSVPTVRIGLRLGLFAALAEAPATAGRTGGPGRATAYRYVREWALAQAANGNVDYDPASDSFSLTPEQAMIFIERDSPVYLPGRLRTGCGDDRGRVQGRRVLPPWRRGALGRPCRLSVLRDRSIFPPRLCQQHRSVMDTGTRRRRAEVAKAARRSPMSVAGWASRRC